MPQSKSPSVVTIRLGSGMRWLLLLPAMLAILGATFTVRWYIGNTVAEYSPNVTEGGLEMARMAVRWAPGDPLTHWRLGTLEEKTFKPETIAAAVREYQEAVATSPNDYRYWMELGRALEAAGDGESGEKALRRAVELAPAYSHPRWTLGNLLLRAGKLDEAFNHLGRAADSDDQMRPQVFDLAMRVLDGNIEQIAKATCTSPAARLQFAIYLVGAQRFADAMRMWGAISPADRRAAPALTAEMEQSLVRAKQYRALLTIMRGSRANADVPPAEQFWNGGFEGPLTPASADVFGWLINSRQLAQITLDSHGHTGKGSLRIVFRAPSTLDKVPVSQTVAVEPGTQYRLEYYVRTENLVTASTPVLTVTDAVDGTVLATSKALPTGTNDWQQATLDFTTKPSHDGITAGFTRAPCNEKDICPIFGSVWYDDFNLQRIGGAGSPGSDAGRIKR